MERVEMSTIERCYCKPQHLTAVVNDLQTQAGNLKTFIGKIGDEFTAPPSTWWAFIGIKREVREYEVILNLYERRE